MPAPRTFDISPRSPSLQHLDAKTMPADVQATFTRLKTAYVKNIVVLDAAGQVVYSTAGDAIGSDNAGSDIDAWARKPVNKGTVRLVVEKSDTPVASTTGEGVKPPSPRLFLVTPLYQEPRARRRARRRRNICRHAPADG